MKITLKQKDFLKTIKNKDTRKYQKQQFKIQNAFASALGMGKGKTWYEENIKETESKFNKLAEKYMPKEDITPKEFCVEITEENQHLLNNVWNTFKNETVDRLEVGKILHSNSYWTHLIFTNDYSCKNKLSKIVSTEEFLKLIGREDLIEGKTPDSVYRLNMVQFNEQVMEFVKSGDDPTNILNQYLITVQKFYHSKTGEKIDFIMELFPQLK